MEQSDFWWLNPSQRTRYQYTKFGHHRPIRENENPSSAYWDTNICSIYELEQWRDRFKNVNVYRALSMASAQSNAKEIIGPFLIDIDNDEDLEDTLVVTRKTLYILHDEFGIGIDSLRIFFTGHKGFNLEIIPQVLGIQGSTYDQIKKSANILDHIIDALRRGKSLRTTNWVSDTGTVVDRIYGDRFGYFLKHPYIRLHDSFNMWISSDGKNKNRMKIELNIDELNELPATEIVSKSEKLAT